VIEYRLRDRSVGGIEADHITLALENATPRTEVDRPALDRAGRIRAPLICVAQSRT
jgi:hypothetical protein